MAEQKAVQAVAASLREVFPYIRAYASVEGWGHHFFLASFSPIPSLSTTEMLARMPLAAQKDLLEWFPGENSVARVVSNILKAKIDPRSLLERDIQAGLTKVTDNTPINEYYLLRRSLLSPK